MPTLVLKSRLIFPMKFQLSTPAASVAANLLADRIAFSHQLHFVEGAIYKMLFIHIPTLAADEATEVLWHFTDVGFLERQGLTYRVTKKLLDALASESKNS